MKWAVAFVRFHDVFLKIKAASLVYLQQTWTSADYNSQ